MFAASVAAASADWSALSPCLYEESFSASGESAVVWPSADTTGTDFFAQVETPFSVTLTARFLPDCAVAGAKERLVAPSIAL